MTKADSSSPLSARWSRRSVLKAGLVAGAGIGSAPLLWQQPAVAGAPGPSQVHLEFGSDPSRQMTVSWVTPTSVSRPRITVGTVDGGAGTTVPALTRTYIDSVSKVEVYTHHATATGLVPSSTHVYTIEADGAPSVQGTFSTAPLGRSAFRFSSFGDQTTGNPQDPLSTPFATSVVSQIEQADPLFHLVNGDLCYADFGLGYVNSTAGKVNPYPPRNEIWGRWFDLVSASAARRPWMPAAGNHENEIGNGPLGYLSYVTRFELPDNGSADFRNYWYSFDVGSVHFVSLQNDDVCYQDAGNTYVRGYSNGAQRAWLAADLGAARSDPGIDWVVVCMHQLALSSAAGRATGGAANGCDLGIRQEFVPLFDKFGVDLVLCGHDHDYERSHAVRGVVSGSSTLQPAVVSTATDTVDTSAGTVHLTLGGGGCGVVTNAYSGSVPGDPTASVTTGRTTYASEPAPWSAVRDPGFAFGYAVFDVDPGTVPGGPTTMKVAYYETPPVGQLPGLPYDTFTLTRPRTDGLRS